VTDIVAREADRLSRRSGGLAVTVLVSGSGTLLQALIDASREDEAFGIVGVVSDRPGIAGLTRAEAAGIPFLVVDPVGFASREEWDRALADELDGLSGHLVVSAGFMRILGPAVLEENLVINTHPALLPSFPGAHAVRDALEHGVAVTGTTCHVVDAGVDTGPIIEQRAVRVEPGDTVETLHERIKVEERSLLVEVVRAIAAGGIRVEGGRVVVGATAAAP
jgi:phosphoribosylglycinamide formyltransferase-1